MGMTNEGRAEIFSQFYIKTQAPLLSEGIRKKDQRVRVTAGAVQDNNNTKKGKKKHWKANYSLKAPLCSL